MTRVRIHLIMENCILISKIFLFVNRRIFNFKNQVLPYQLFYDIPIQTFCFSDLLERVYEKMKINNPDLKESSKFTIEMPNVGPLGSRKTMWSNFEDIANKVKRKLDHFSGYVSAELGTEVNTNEKNQLILKGRFTPNQIKSILKNYLKEYVKCNNCKSYNTELEKDASIRTFILKCKACGASNSVSKVTKGFHNMARGERRKK
jgi:translation initiation factor 2 subunit 2